MEISLIDIYQDKNRYYSLLYQLLSEREIDEAISHNTMPTWDEHKTYLDKTPNKYWFIICANLTGEKDIPFIPVGSIYLSWKNEVGIAIFKKYRRIGLGKQAIIKLIKEFKFPFYIANINPTNQKSIDLFEKLGFTHIQNTYRLENKDAVS